MNEIIVRTPSFSFAEEILFSMLKTHQFEILEAKINCCISTGLVCFERENYFPLVLDGYLYGEKTRLLISSITIGSDNSSSNAVLHLLQEAGFEVDKNDILTPRRQKTIYNSWREAEQWIHLKYVKEKTAHK